MKWLLIFLLLAINAKAAVQFNGTTQRISTIANGSSLPPGNIPNAMSVSMWIKQHYTNGMCPLFSAGGGAFWNYDIGISNAATNALRFRYTSSATGFDHIYTTAPNAIPNSNVWTHVGMTYVFTDAASMKFYVNGTLQSGGWVVLTGGVAPASIVTPSFLATDNAGKFGAVTISEFALFWQTILSPRRMQMLATSKMSGIQRQFDIAAPVYVASTNCLGIYWPLNDAVAFSTVTGTNFYKGRGVRVNAGGSALFPIHGSPIGSPTTTAEVVCSYQPNE